ncbi:glycosyltransferase family 1 protein [Candidatus Parcubacteria bacterium]|nr:MAG: glycosyltransferase family 1 protein [Candidatus Parcubacteria bacterium]
MSVLSEKPVMQKQALVITRNFPPLVGGMERLMAQAFKELGREYRCILIGPQGCEQFVPAPHQATGCSLAHISVFLMRGLSATILQARRYDFDFCMAGSGVTAPLAWAAKLFFGIPAISFIHGLDLIAESPTYQQIFIPALRQMDLVIANSNNTARLAKAKGIRPERIEILHPGVELPAPAPAEDDRLAGEYNLEGKKILLSVGRLVPRKGLAEFLRFSFPDILAACPETVLVIIGEEPANALSRANGARREIEQVIREQALADHVLLLGRAPDEKLAAFFQRADLFVFPVREVRGDVEGFGMVAMEAAAYGVPTVAFATGGVPDAVRDQWSGFLVKTGDYQSFARVTVQYLTGQATGVNPERCRAFAAQFSWNHFGRRLLELCSRGSRQP